MALKLLEKRDFSQNVIDIRQEPIPFICLVPKAFSIPAAKPFVQTTEPIGIAVGYNKKGHLNAIALSLESKCMIIEGDFTAKKLDLKPLQSVLAREAGDLVGFDFGPLAMSIYDDIGGCRVVNAVDIQSAFPKVPQRDRLESIKSCLGDTYRVNDQNVLGIFKEQFYIPAEDKTARDDLVSRAWVAAFLARNDSGVFDRVERIDTLNRFDEKSLDMISKLAKDAHRRDAMKPQEVNHTFTQARDPQTGQLQASSESYKDRIRGSRRTVRMTVANQDGGQYTVRAETDSVDGRLANLGTHRSIHLGATSVLTITSTGPDRATRAEAMRARTVLLILQGHTNLLDDNPWIQNIWLRPDREEWPENWKNSPDETEPNLLPSFQTLNTSQQAAVTHMLTLDHPITLIQGPPGTGKTSVIAEFVQSAINSGRTGIWLVAASNVAVKNIAEKLAKVGFMDWRLLVSRDFHFDWHEHLYAAAITENIIRSEQFERLPLHRVRDCKVFLCTLSMLANKQIRKRFTSHLSASMKTLVVDEASQIEIGDYFACFRTFQSTLRKVCFIGDDKQLPPHGAEDIDNLDSIFEVAHIRSKGLFLDTQYRMPPQLGAFISDAVYDGKLKSNPLHPVTDETPACLFVHTDGKEQREPGGTSYFNRSEHDMVIRIATMLQSKNMSYRIITPYEGQRALVEKTMKELNLDWHDRCFNVDSFQGNEEDFIVLTLVRSEALGFLSNLRRTNVMLTRCKRGMYIVSNKRFLAGKGAESLAGGLLKKYDEVWLSDRELGLKASDEVNLKQGNESRNK